MNIKEIAKLAGVSASTVSKIVNQKDESISSETRERVLKIVKEYNYTPYASAIVPTQKTWILGILLRSFISFDTTLDGMIQSAQQNGYTTIVCNSCSDPEQELKNITSLCSSHVDGILWEPVDGQSLSFLHYIEDKGIPYITIGPFGGSGSLQIPYETFGFQITQELISRRHTKIACLLTEGRRVQAFLDGYKSCLFQNHLPSDEQLIFHELDETLIYKVNTHQISGIISSHYLKALEFYQLMNALHYRIPEDFSLVSLKNDRLEAPEIPEISTYTVSNTEFGSYLCKNLICQIEKSSGTLPAFTQDFKLDHDTTIGMPFELNTSKIIVIGSINMDTYLNVEQLPDTGKTVSTSSSFVYPGGKGINQSIGASKLGQHVALIGNVGFDMDSDNIFRALNEHGVDTFGIKRCFQVNTGKAYIFVEQGGDSMISILAGANDIFTPDAIREKENLFENTGYCLIQSEIPVETVQEACLVAHKHHVKTILKPSACSYFPEELLSNVDIIIPNEDELNVLCPGQSSIEERAGQLMQYGIETVIITLGERGCYVKTEDWEESFPAAPFTSVDNTGASDAFISALASYLLYGYSLKNAVRIATYAAGFCISRKGVVPSLIDKNSLESYILQKEPELLQLR
ncbi:MAG: LacI family DNA-binding transcriptional regulator [Lachnospiraceae bacterium]|jgi:ribokinase|nr:LacI family DNA-binding transcriptional regulator [Lachnospiraceae bacterium]